MIYSKDELIDCEYVRQKDFVRGFLSKFYGEIAGARARNFTAPASAAELAHRRRRQQQAAGSGEYAETLHDFQLLTGARRDEDAHAYGNEVDEVDAADADAFGMRTLEYKQLRRIEDVPDEMRALLKYGELKQQCDERHRQLKRIVHDLASGETDRREAAAGHLER